MGDQHQRVAEDVATAVVSAEACLLDRVGPLDAGGDEDVCRRAGNDLLGECAGACIGDCDCMAGLLLPGGGEVIEPVFSEAAANTVTFSARAAGAAASAARQATATAKTAGGVSMPACNLSLSCLDMSGGKYCARRSRLQSLFSARHIP
jgi:hypothetical protein